MCKKWMVLIGIVLSLASCNYMTDIVPQVQESISMATEEEAVEIVRQALEKAILCDQLYFSIKQKEPPQGGPFYMLIMAYYKAFLK